MIEVVQEPVVEPVSLAEAKAHLRVDLDDDDFYIMSLIAAARRLCERHTQRCFVATTLDQFVPAFEAGGYWDRDVRRSVAPGDPGWLPAWAGGIKLLRAPLLSVVHVRYSGPDGSERVVPAPAGVRVVRAGATCIAPPIGSSWPSDARDPVVRYVCGYGEDASRVPATIKHAIKLLVGSWYDVRESVVQGTVSQLPDGVERLLGLESWGADY